MNSSPFPLCNYSHYSIYLAKRHISRCLHRFSQIGGEEVPIPKTIAKDGKEVSEAAGCEDHAGNIHTEKRTLQNETNNVPLFVKKLAQVLNTLSLKGHSKEVDVIINIITDVEYDRNCFASHVSSHDDCL